VPTWKAHTDYCYKTDSTRHSIHQNGRAARCNESCVIHPKQHKLHHKKKKEHELFVDHKVDRKCDMEMYVTLKEKGK
jgi:hypothetical protein